MIVIISKVYCYHELLFIECNYVGTRFVRINFRGIIKSCSLVNIEGSRPVKASVQIKCNYLFPRFIVSYVLKL